VIGHRGWYGRTSNGKKECATIFWVAIRQGEINQKWNVPAHHKSINHFMENLYVSCMEGERMCNHFLVAIRQGEINQKNGMCCKSTNHFMGNLCASCMEGE
jgi:hypothetical protein